ncbi:MAG: tetratricopeptide repeat protein [Myxococcales bacterium]|nr:tetratricopeptide repeat protein [Myxococcales bacterium]
MLNLLVAFAAGLAVTLAVRLGGFQLYAGIIPGTVVFLGTYLVLARRVFKKIQDLTGEAHKELTASANPREQQQRAAKAVKILESGLRYARWQFLVASQIHGGIGQIKYILKDHEGALAAFAKAHSRDYMALMMRGALHYQRKQYEEMEKAFEGAVKAGKKEGLAWASYAWCLLQLKEKEKALKVMGRAVQANPSDEKLKSGLTALQNDKKLKMRAWEPMWWSLGLETPPVQMQGRQVRFLRR